MARRTEIVPGRLIGWDDSDPRRVLLRYERILIEVSVSGENVVRLRAAVGSALPADPFLALGRDPWRPVSVNAFERAGIIHIDDVHAGAGWRVDIDPRQACVALVCGGARAMSLERILFRASGGAAVSARVAERSVLTGFGEKAGRLDKRGAVLKMRNRDADMRAGGDPLYVAIPFFLAATPPPPGDERAPARAAGLFADCFAPSRFDVARSEADVVRIDVESNSLDVFLVPGPSAADVIRRFTTIVGRMPMPPRWAIGYHQSRWGYDSQAKLEEVARELRTRRIPADVLMLDIDYMRGFRVFTWDPQRFPDPAAMLARLAADGFRVVTIVDPGVKVDAEYPVYAEALARGYLCRRSDGSIYTVQVWPGASALPDFNRAEVRQWWAQQHRALTDAGVAGIWNDMNEPAGWQRDVRMGRLILPYRNQNTDGVVQADPVDESRTLSHEEVRNLYGLQECRATFAGLQEARPQERPFVLSRSGYAGIQRYAAIWTGDNASRWSDLRQSISMLLGLSLSGVAFCGSDIGGFSLSCPSELYARWIQLGALYPFSRTHSMWLGRHQEPYNFGPRVEAVAREAIGLRMRLMPYLYSLFHQAHRTGAPVWRPLFYEFPQDAACYGVDDQLMLGPSLMLAPVLGKRERTRKLYLPPGEWMTFDDAVTYTGPGWITVRAPLRRLPMLARVPSLIPTQSLVQHAGEVPEEPLIVQVFAGSQGRRGRSSRAATAMSASFDVFEDDGLSRDHERGIHAVTRLSVHQYEASIVVEIAVREGAFELPARQVRLIVRGAGDAAEVRCDGRTMAVTNARGDGGGQGIWACRSGEDLEIGVIDDGRSARVQIVRELAG
ncbi:MAG TPA: TIM-barrel domain-containing protein [Candidatus Limnocylindrales bacterium]|nr:TIM-barrel domain-containing protein [Candidatus Limnocylindrales bacterium]